MPEAGHKKRHSCRLAKTQKYETPRKQIEMRNCLSCTQSGRKLTNLIIGILLEGFSLMHQKLEWGTKVCITDFLKLLKFVNHVGKWDRKDQ